MTDTQILLTWLVIGVVGWFYYLVKMAYLEAKIKYLERKSRNLAKENQTPCTKKRDLSD